MVKGMDALRARFKAVPAVVRDEVTEEIAKQASQIVAQMRLLNPNPAITIGWTWGSAPAGSLVIAQSSGGQDFGRVQATIYATGPNLQGRVPISLARLFEFGTGQRRQRTTGRRTGAMPAQPYFFPVYRANRQAARAAITRAVTRGVKKA